MNRQLQDLIRHDDAFYFNPLDIAGFTLLGSLNPWLIVGLSAE